MIEGGAQLAGRKDPDVCAALVDLFHDEGIKGGPRKNTPALTSDVLTT
jgi:hypothetical protein